MANLNVENLSRIVESGNIEQMYGGGGAPATGGFSEFKASEIARAEGVTPTAAGAQGNNFMDVLKSSMDKVNVNQTQADQAVRELVSGRSKNIHETLLAVERADSSLKLMMQVRNKILEAYKEVMRMQV